MFYHLFYPLKDIFFGFNVFRYVTFRAGFAAVTAFLISILAGKIIIPKLQKFGLCQNLREKEVGKLFDLHKHKKATPTMGGIIILLGITLSTVLWSTMDNVFIFLVLSATLCFGAIGFLDDYLKHIKNRSLGLTISMKLLFQIPAALLFAFIIYKLPSSDSTLELPFLKEKFIVLGIMYLFFSALVIIGSSNAVNLTDGLDGLAIGCVIMVTLTFTVLSYLTSHFQFSNYLGIFFLPQAGEITVFCASVFGASLGFLWFNSYPATVFMGDTGSLSLGGALGIVAVLIKKELLLFLCGGIFVAEAVSVIIQIISFKFFGKRIFKVAPVHHHFQIKGWHESKVVLRIWIIASILALLSLATLKLR